MTQAISIDDRTAQTLAVVSRFNDALNRGDLDAAMDEMTADVLFENTSPFPDGEPFVGIPAVRAFFQSMIDGNQRLHFDVEEIFASDNRCTVRWNYHWIDKSGVQGHIRGVDVFKIRDGRICEKLAYVKG